MHWIVKFLLAMIISVTLLQQVTALPTQIRRLDEVIETSISQMMPEEAYKIEAKNDLGEKSVRLLGFLNTLNTLGSLVGSSPLGVLGIGTNNNRMQDTTPRLNGRPGLGFIPDVTKGVNKILEGVVSGNLEQILEGSFVFAPTGVQLVAGGVLNRVFLPTKATSPNPSVTSTITPIMGSSTATSTKMGTSTVKKSYTHQEAQLELLKIILEQQKQINALETIRNAESTTVKADEAAIPVES